MKINWKVRIKNPVFWANLAAAIILPILTYLGLNWSDMTTWAGLGGVLLEAVKNPVILVAVVVSVWNLINESLPPRGAWIEIRKNRHANS